MRRSPVLLVLATLAMIMLGAGPAWGHDPEHDHPGIFLPSPEGNSANMHLLASAPRTGSFSGYRNSDLAFWGRLAVAGNYEGFRTFDISDPESPRTLVDFPCFGQQQDVSIWGGLLFTSVDTPLTGPECGSTPVPGTGTGWEGIRVFDISDPAAPRFVTAVATDCGSHTHTLVPDPAGNRVLVYVSSYPISRTGPTPFGTDCQRLLADGSQGHSKISIIEVPLDDPAAARVAAQPRFDLRDFDTPGLRGCHDITVFMELRRAAAACLSEGQIWDISDPMNPRTISRVHNSAVDIWHSSTFTWDGRLVLFGDEAGGGGAPRCRDQSDRLAGAMWFYDLAALDANDATTEEAPLGSFKIDRFQGSANCTTHNFNVLPVSGRYVAVSAYYAAGTTVIDFTDPANAREVGYFDPHGANTWSSYWYNGFIYTNDSGRGMDVMLLSDPARAGARKLPFLNPQTQMSPMN